MRLHRVLRFTLSILILFPMLLEAQITAPGSSAVRMTDYPSTTRDDQIFIFCVDDAADRGSLTAAVPAATPPFTFTWTRYNPTGGLFSIAVLTESGTTSTASNLVEGGYRVNVTNAGGYDTTMYAWVSLDMPVAGAALLNYTCDYVALDGTAAADPFYYYDPSTAASRLLPNAVSFLWSSTPSSTIPYPDLELDPVTYSPPLEDVEYMLQVTDSFGCVSTSSFDYTSIHVSADFSADPISGEAPLSVTFTDNSVRGYYYTWKFGDDTISHLSDPPAHTYYIPDEYEVTLIIESELTCIDSATVTITVEPSKLNIPNVFSPDQDGINDYFLPDKASLRFINVQIFSKSGRRVYYYEGKGEDLQNWTGWDGKINYSDRDAEPGTYYYLIRAYGYDDVEYKGSSYRGTLYLYR